MIILSGVLVILAIALLVAGIVAGAGGVGGIEGLTLIYISIGISVVSALCLLIGLVLRWNDIFGPTGAVVPPKGKAAKAKKPGRAARKAQAAKQAAGEDAPDGEGAEPAAGETIVLATQPAEVPVDAEVYVVRGRRRYHLETCRQLAGHDKEELTYGEAREEGFSPCTACMPDTALAARAAAVSVTEKPGQDEQEPALTPGAAAHQEAAAEEPTATLTPPSSFTQAGSPEDWPAEGDQTAQDLPVVGSDRPWLSRADDEPSWSPAAEGNDAPWLTALDTLDTPDAAADGTDEPGVPDEAEAPVGEPVAVEETPAVVGDAEQADGSEDADDAGDDLQVRILSGTTRYHRVDCALIEDIGEDTEDLESLARSAAKERGCTPCLVCQPDKS